MSRLGMMGRSKPWPRLVTRQLGLTALMPLPFASDSLQMTATTTAPVEIVCRVFRGQLSEDVAVQWREWSLASVTVRGFARAILHGGHREPGQREVCFPPGAASIPTNGFNLAVSTIFKLHKLQTPCMEVKGTSMRFRLWASGVE